jgi:hypothetical protein
MKEGFIMSNLLVSKEFLMGEEIPETFKTDKNIDMQYDDESRVIINKSYLAEFKKQYPNIEVLTPEEFTEYWFLNCGYVNEAAYEIAEEDETLKGIFGFDRISEHWQKKIVKKFIKDEVSIMTDDEAKKYIWEDRDDIIKKYIRPIMIDIAMEELRDKINSLKCLKEQYVNDNQYIKVR